MHGLLRRSRGLRDEQNRAHSPVARETSLSRAASDRLVGAVFSAISDALASNEAVTIAECGTFDTRNRASRQRRTPRIEERVDIVAARAPSFKASKTLRDTVNR